MKHSFQQCHSSSLNTDPFKRHLTPTSDKWAPGGAIFIRLSEMSSHINLVFRHPMLGAYLPVNLNALVGISSHIHAIF